jgi:hypothetical protein
MHYLALAAFKKEQTMLSNCADKGGSSFELLFGSQDPDPHQSDKQDPDPYQSDKLDLDPHLSITDPQHSY